MSFTISVYLNKIWADLLYWCGGGDGPVKRDSPFKILEKKSKLITANCFSLFPNEYLPFYSMPLKEKLQKL